MHKLWQASLTRSVIVTLACAMSAFWLLSETISFYYRYSKAEVEVREDLDWELNGVAEEENRRYELAQVRVNTLLRLWSELLRNASLPGTQSNELKHTVFVPFDGVDVDQERIAVAGQVIEIFGNSDSVNRTETFLLVPGQGVLFYRPEGQTAADMQAKMHALLSRQYRSTTSDNCWGSVFEDGQGHLRSAVTAIDARSGITAGQLLRIDDLNARKYDFSYILRDAGGRLLWSDNREESALLAAQGVQPDCQRKAMEMAGFIVDCTLLRGRHGSCPPSHAVMP